ncbi:MAG: tetratricopeptide repeat protein [Paramuribaculum sp.]|nr:tetratricopeptide repeat protein [Paramuribaculum sp.]
MQPPQPDNEMRRLYERFVRSLADQSDLSVYSEDDLLDIYDYTRSIPDDYVAMEVLIAGSRMYPANEDLAKRKVLFMHDFEQDTAVVESATHLPVDSLVRTIAIFKVDRPETVEAAKERLLRAVTRQHKHSIEDGDVYFLIETLNDIGMLDAVSDTSKVLREYIAYPTTLDQELYKIYSEKGDAARAISHCQALTESEPFEANWWELLANAYTNLSDDKAAALEAIEYALALDPESRDGQLLKATLVAAENPEQSKELCKAVLRKAPDYRPALFLYAYLQFITHEGDEALDLLRRYAIAEDESIDKNFFEMLFENVDGTMPDDFMEMLRGYVGQLELPDVYLWALQLSDSGQISGTADVLEAARPRPEFMSSTPMVRLLAEAYYRTGRYADVVELAEAMPENDAAEDLLLTLYYALSRKRMDMTDGLHALLEARLVKSTLVVMEGLSVSERNMMLRGVRHHLVSLLKSLMGEDIPEQAYDPFTE